MYSEFVQGCEGPQYLPGPGIFMHPFGAVRKCVFVIMRTKTLFHHISPDLLFPSFLQISSYDHHSLQVILLILAMALPCQCMLPRAREETLVMGPASAPLLEAVVEGVDEPHEAYVVAYRA